VHNTACKWDSVLYPYVVLVRSVCDAQAEICTGAEGMVLWVCEVLCELVLSQEGVSDGLAEHLRSEGSVCGLMCVWINVD
jgi:hypothetical protein